VIALVDDGFTAKQLILGEHIILRAHNENYADIVVKGSLELFGVVVSSVRRFKR
jgi:DNA polymerase V